MSTKNSQFYDTLEFGVIILRKILIIEDEPDIQELLEAYLRGAGYATVLAGDGVEGIECFWKERCDLILLDIMLPKIDGFGVGELIRRESAVPIVMLTALDGEQEQLRGFQLEIDDYATKPFSMPVLLQKIRAILRRAGEGAEEVPGTAAGSGSHGSISGGTAAGADCAGI